MIFFQKFKHLSEMRIPLFFEGMEAEAMQIVSLFVLQVGMQIYNLNIACNITRLKKFLATC